MAGAAPAPVPAAWPKPFPVVAPCGERTLQAAVQLCVPLQHPRRCRRGSSAGQCSRGIVVLGVVALARAGLQSTRRARHACRTAKAAGKRKDLASDFGISSVQGVPTLPIPEVSEEEAIPIGEANIQKIRTMQLNQLNNNLKRQWKKQRQGKRTVPPKIEFVPRPDNPWRDRYLLCGDCERRADYKGMPPRRDCNCSTLLELDMTAPWSRDNVMATSCQIVQMIRDDVWVRREPDGSFARVDGKHAPGTFPVQVCAVCKKTSLEEGRRFRMCMTCHGVSYCSDECYGKHRLKHRTSCTIPELPYREEWGIRKQLRKMRDEIYPLIHHWAIREAAKHRIAWLPPPEHLQKALPGAEVRRPILPGFSRNIPTLPAASTLDAEVKDGKLALVAKQPRKMHLYRPLRKGPAEPDPIQLLNLGMTREEYIRKDAQSLAIAEQEQAALVMQSSLTAQDSAPEENAAVPVERLMPMLSAEAVERLDAAAAEAPTQPVEELARAPWEEAEEEEAKRLGGRRELVKKRLLPPNMPAPEQRKDGVVYKETLVRELAQKRGLQLSEEALQRLEEAAAAGKKKVPDKIDPRYKRSLF